MSYGRPLRERERALEDAFFRREEDRKRANREAVEDRREAFERLADVLGPRDPALIDPLLDVGLRAENATALVMAPLVVLAWDDHQLEAGERTRILRAELELGVDPGGEDGALVAQWLAHRPSDRLLDVWAAYVTALSHVMDDTTRAALRDDILRRCRSLFGAIARALVRGRGPTRSEREILERIEAAFRLENDPKPKRGGGVDDVVRLFS